MTLEEKYLCCLKREKALCFSPGSLLFVRMHRIASLLGVLQPFFSRAAFYFVFFCLHIHIMENLISRKAQNRVFLPPRVLMNVSHTTCGIPWWNCCFTSRLAALSNLCGLCYKKGAGHDCPWRVFIVVWHHCHPCDIEILNLWYLEHSPSLLQQRMSTLTAIDMGSWVWTHHRSANGVETRTLPIGLEEFVRSPVAQSPISGGSHGRTLAQERRSIPLNIFVFFGLQFGIVVEEKFKTRRYLCHPTPHLWCPRCGHFEFMIGR